jgi:cytidylate kinase
MSDPVSIAIDGPVASGKSTIGRDLARALASLYLDTGVMYRGLTFLALERGVDPSDESALTALAEAVCFSFPELGQADAVNPPLLADGKDITAGLRGPAVDRHVSAVSSYPGVRAAMARQQRAIARTRSVVMVGRDIGTVVLPNATVKFFVTAGTEERARRRNSERRASGIDEPFEDTLADLQRRDRLDSTRAVAPLRQAPDAILVDNSSLTREQVLEQVLATVDERLGSAPP